jgi:hypothetical protein
MDLSCSIPSQIFVFSHNFVFFSLSLALLIWQAGTPTLSSPAVDDMMIIQGSFSKQHLLSVERDLI